MEHTPWPQAAARTLADQVYLAVRARILSGALKPGEFIREKELERMGVSRTPIREALGRLASEGFLERIPHRGFRVPEESVGNLLQLYPIVAALDLLAGRLALERFTAEDVARLREINRALDEAGGRRDVRALIELNNRFHRVFSERSGNERLCDLLDDLRVQLARLEPGYYSSGGRAQQSAGEHDAIIQAIEAGDREAALSVLENNMSLTYRTLLRESAESS